MTALAPGHISYFHTTPKYWALSLLHSNFHQRVNFLRIPPQNFGCTRSLLCQYNSIPVAGPSARSTCFVSFSFHNATVKSAWNMDENCASRSHVHKAISCSLSSILKSPAPSHRSSNNHCKTNCIFRSLKRNFSTNWPSLKWLIKYKKIEQLIKAKDEGHAFEEENEVKRR